MSKNKMAKIAFHQREISWLFFNDRVLHEAADLSNALHERLRFLGIFSNNLDEFYRVRVATLRRTIEYNKKLKKDNTANNLLLDQIENISLSQQATFIEIYESILLELKKNRIQIIDHLNINEKEKKYLENYFVENILSEIVPLMIESIPELPILNERNLYLACILGNTNLPLMQTYCLIEIPTNHLNRFIILPESRNIKKVILLEDIIKLCMPLLFAQFGFNAYEYSIIKVTRDAELNLDNDIDSNMLNALEKGLKSRNKSAPTRFIYEKNIDYKLLQYLTRLLNLKEYDAIIPSGKVHNFKDFMNFPKSIFDSKDLFEKHETFIHPQLIQPIRILKVLDKEDILLQLPYHKFDSIIDFLREVSIDPYITSIKITCYRLAKNSKIINALLNAARNGKQITVVLELKARFDEAANIQWMKVLQEEGIQVITTPKHRKVHAKLCVATKKEFGKEKLYGFVSTGNLNEQTSNIYSDICLLTGRQDVLKESLQVFSQIEKAQWDKPLKDLKFLITSPTNTRQQFIQLIKNEVKAHKAKKPSGIIIKLNSLSDELIINELSKAIKEGVAVSLIIRGIFCLDIARFSNKRSKAISIVDSYLEHARVFWFCNNNKPKVYIGSADWMTRNLDYRIEACILIDNNNLKQEIYDLLKIQLSDNVKARKIDGQLSHEYVTNSAQEENVRSQLRILEYLKNKIK
jgi:polyphosphate kinase